MAEQPHGNALTPEEQDEIFVKLQPYLQRGHKLWRCIVFAGLTSRKDAIYKYYNERGTFYEKIEASMGFFAKIIGEINSVALMQIYEKAQNKQPLFKEELDFASRLAMTHTSTREEYNDRKEVTGKDGAPLVPTKLDEAKKEEMTGLIDGIIEEATNEEANTHSVLESIANSDTTG
jgi:hypothetical protein